MPDSGWANDTLPAETVDQAQGDEFAVKPNDGAEIPDEAELDASAEATSLLGIISEYLRSLFRIAVLIRKAGPRDRFKHALQHSDTTFTDILDVSHLREKYPKLSPAILKSLGAANAKRRQFFKYCRDHKTRLSHEHEEENRPTGSRAARTELVSSKATTFVQPVLLDTGNYTCEIDEDDAVSQMTASTVSGGKMTLSLPRLATLSPDGDPFECPICRTFQDFLTERGWQRHAFRDLKAYSCTAGCDKMFGDRSRWFEHELAEHLTRYTCSLCVSSSESFSESSLRRHVSQAHSTVPEHMISGLLSSGRISITRFRSSDCPFCDDWGTALVAKLDPAGTRYGPENKGISVTTSRFRRHVAAHLEQVAIFAVPRENEEDELEDGPGSNAAGPASVASSITWSLHSGGPSEDIDVDEDWENPGEPQLLSGRHGMMSSIAEGQSPPQSNLSNRQRELARMYMDSNQKLEDILDALREFPEGRQPLPEMADDSFNTGMADDHPSLPGELEQRGDTVEGVAASLSREEDTADKEGNPGTETAQGATDDASVDVARIAADVIEADRLAEAEQELRDEEMEVLYQIRLTHRREREESVARKEEEARARAAGDSVALAEIRSRHAAEREASALPELRQIHRQIKEGQQRDKGEPESEADEKPYEAANESAEDMDLVRAARERADDEIRKEAEAAAEADALTAAHHRAEVEVLEAIETAKKPQATNRQKSESTRCDLVNEATVPGKRCPKCTDLVWVLPGRCCPYCGTYVGEMPSQEDCHKRFGTDDEESWKRVMEETVLKDEIAARKELEKVLEIQEAAREQIALENKRRGKRPDFSATAIEYEDQRRDPGEATQFTAGHIGNNIRDSAGTQTMGDARSPDEQSIEDTVQSSTSAPNTSKPNVDTADARVSATTTEDTSLETESTGRVPGSSNASDKDDFVDLTHVDHLRGINKYSSDPGELPRSNEARGEEPLHLAVSSSTSQLHKSLPAGPETIDTEKRQHAVFQKTSIRYLKRTGLQRLLEGIFPGHSEFSITMDDMWWRFSAPRKVSPDEINPARLDYDPESPFTYEDVYSRP
ncbi:uncharacterized protein B0I36DRAFT_363460 [Microdochium trichocladiopsis]|uniref:C2H2-type domain-containing protein n=1 Tax=Microdochium trichocladiopsis TaxID=1682393 RepID=A0A9P9BP25_9PEZI|nr:uncharacterized protein B0I36DRAFT_363460 [Microdochium trichocladiopsis]KAH7028839.1 hypothetical protein B0I36DRAFT_363460 [Microdochium trichocladiopsis]